MVSLELYWARICFLRDFLKEARDRQFLVVLLIEFQIIGPWILIVFSASLVLVPPIFKTGLLLPGWVELITSTDLDVIFKNCF